LTAARGRWQSEAALATQRAETQMLPHVFGLNVYFTFWLVAAIAGIACGLRSAERAGLPRRAALIGLVGVAAAIVIGSKLQYLVEHVFFPYDDPEPLPQDSVWQMSWHGFRIPGGILLMGAVLPLLCRRLGLPTRRFADAIMPGVGLAIVCVRLGCFCNGCCFGAVTGFPIAITFPPGARVYDWQVMQGLIGGPAARTLPVHPLQLYFAALGLAIYALARHWQDTKRADGEVWAHCFLLFFGGTFVLELLRPTPLHLNLILTALVVAATWFVKLRVRPAAVAAVTRS
jgi:phosphatidylglycerol:prolipoprotein diacylglycerol transferase